MLRVDMSIIKRILGKIKIIFLNNFNQKLKTQNKKKNKKKNSSNLSNLWVLYSSLSNCRQH